MVQPHRQPVHLQPFAPGAIDRDAPGRDDGVDQRRLRAGRQPREHFGEIAERAGRQSREAVLVFCAHPNPPNAKRAKSARRRGKIIGRGSFVNR